MASSDHGGGISPLLSYSVIADRARLALTRITENQQAPSQGDRNAIKRAQGFLDFATEAQLMVTEKRMKGFTVEGIQVRQATYDACKTLSKEEQFELIAVLEKIKGILDTVLHPGEVELAEVEEAKSFLLTVRDLFRARSAHPMEVVGRHEAIFS